MGRRLASFALLLPLFAAEPFWNVKPPSEWSPEEVSMLLHQSPWATISIANGAASIPAHLATPQVMRDAEGRERQALRYRLDPGANFDEYRELIQSGRYIALAVFVRDAIPISDGLEAKSLETDSVLHIGRRAYKLVAHFPPTPGDPYLRYIFPSDVQARDRALFFDIYVPGVTYPQRHLEFDLREMRYKGKLVY